MTRSAVAPRELRKFCGVFVAVLVVAAVAPLVRGGAVRGPVLGAAVGLSAIGALLPQVLAPLYRGWMWLGHWMGQVTSRVVLAVVFLTVVTPMGLFLRFVRKDPLRRKLDKTRPSYFEARQTEPQSMTRLF